MTGHKRRKSESGPGEDTSAASLRLPGVRRRDDSDCAGRASSHGVRDRTSVRAALAGSRSVDGPREGCGPGGEDGIECAGGRFSGSHRGMVSRGDAGSASTRAGALSGLG